MTNHADLARDAFDLASLPAPPRAVEHALGYITRLLSMLPAAERFGYVRGPRGGENVAALPDGTLVRVSRVMTTDGQIYKVLNDAPNGGPQWVLEDIRPDLYVPFTGTHVPDTGTPVPDVGTGAELRHALLWIEHLKTRTELLQDAFGEVSRQIGALNQQIAELTNRPAPPLPPLHVQVFGYKVPVKQG